MEKFLKNPPTPLLPVALSFSAGILLDRLLSISLGVALLLTLGGLLAWCWARSHKNPLFPLVWLCSGLVAMGAANHHWRRNLVPSNHISKLATSHPRLMRLRGIVVQEPLHIKGKRSPLRTFPPKDKTNVLLEVSELFHQGGWIPSSGRVFLTVDGILDQGKVGEEIEVIGQVNKIPSPGNPGEEDWAVNMRDKDIHARVNVYHTHKTVKIRSQGIAFSLEQGLALIRRWARKIISEYLPRSQQGLAQGLLLGDQSAVTGDHWKSFRQKGVVHVLAVSGLHLGVLAGFLALVFRLAQLPSRRRAGILILIIVTYALLTGARVPVIRATLLVSAFCLGRFCHRMVVPTNLLAFAWLVICLINPTQIFHVGCQLSFLAVIILVSGLGLFTWPEKDPLDKLEDLQRPLWQKGGLWLLSRIGMAYLSALCIWLALAPLIAARFHLVSPAGLVIGPIVTLFTSLALIMGLLMFISALVFWPLAWFFARLTQASLSVCESLVHGAENFPGAYFYVPKLPEWWLAGFYLLLLAGLLLPVLRARFSWVAIALVLWCIIGLLPGLFRPTNEGLRCTFLSVGHGGCVVIETNKGRVILYDAGSLAGPHVTEWHIAPFLWSRGIHRVDEVILSHGDLDHFNGLPSLVERFSIGQVTCTPTFSERDLPGLRLTLQSLQKRNIPIRIVTTGDSLKIDDLTFYVLHPPNPGPTGEENLRSMVLYIHHKNHTILLTGDLDKSGLTTFLNLPAPQVDVLMAPHHGSALANIPKLAEMTRPLLAISSQGQPLPDSATAKRYQDVGAIFLTTWEHGAISIHSTDQGLFVETFRTGKKWKLME